MANAELYKGLDEKTAELLATINERQSNSFFNEQTIIIQKIGIKEKMKITIEVEGENL